METPASLGYRWPAEWERQAAVWLSWPHNRDSWPGKFEPIPGQFAEFVRAIARFEPVHILAGSEAVMAEARSLVGELPNVTLHDVRTNDAWCRDHGPIFLAKSPHADASLPPALIDWQYNAWGGKYPPFDADNEVPRQVAECLGYRRFARSLVLEGGSIEGNGAGTLLTTECCLLNPNRNPSESREEIEQQLRENLGVTKILWLRTDGIAGDDTDGHIDQLARFANATTIVAAVCEDRDDENFEPLRANWEQLQAMTDQAGRPFEVVPLPMPRALYYDDARLPACYCNFLIVNGGVIVPVFGDDAADERACRTLASCFPDREIVPLYATDLVWGLGAYHCLSQQQPVHDPAVGS
ncbi:MAG: agmatine deiminase family protein [Pirellulaceae bacterium]